MIRTDEDARRYAAAQVDAGETITLHGDLVIKRHVCQRCGGAGGWKGWPGFTCYDCGGRNSRWTTRTPIKRWAQAHARRQRAAERRHADRVARQAKREAESLDRQRAWSAEHGHGAITFAELDAKRAAERAAERNVPAPVGRVTFRGVVVSVKSYYGAYGTSTKATVKVTTPDGVWLAWGTVPAALLSGDGTLRGAEVELTATLKPGREPHFALMSRPRGSIVAAAQDVQGGAA